MKKSQQSLKNWTAQKWRTSDGSESKGKKRYLPDAAWDALSSGEKAATNRAKAEGNKKGNQFVAQPEKIKEKTKSFRKTGGESPSNIKTNAMKNLYKKGGKSSKPKMKESWMEESKEVHFGSKPKPKMMGGKKDLYKKGGFPDLNKDGKTTFADVLEGRGVEMKKGGGAKSMEPGGGGRFAKMVAGLKKKGKSEESAKAIAASAGRNKYGKSRFQEMAAAGKRKKEEGGFEDEEMEMEMEMESTESSMKPKKRKKVNASAAARKRGNAARKNQRRGRTGCYSGNCAESMSEI